MLESQAWVKVEAVSTHCEGLCHTEYSIAYCSDDCSEHICSNVRQALRLQCVGPTQHVVYMLEVIE